MKCPAGGCGKAEDKVQPPATFGLCEISPFEPSASCATEVKRLTLSRTKCEGLVLLFISRQETVSVRWSTK